jgi:hypothetical protein
MITTHTVPTLAWLRQQRDTIIEIARHHRASDIRVFGSVARGDADPDSDIDLIVDFEPKASLYDMAGLMLDWEAFPGHKVDIVELHDGNMRFQQRILNDVVSL